MFNRCFDARSARFEFLDEEWKVRELSRGCSRPKVVISTTMRVAKRDTCFKDVVRFFDAGLKCTCAVTVETVQAGTASVARTAGKIARFQRRYVK